MRTLRYLIILLACLPLVVSCSDTDTAMPSTRKERKLILKGNEAFEAEKYQDAANFYRQALEANPGSPEALFNNAVATMAVAQQMMAKQGSQPDSATIKLQDEALQMYMQASMLRERASGIAALACYNLGNHYFRTDKLDEAEVYYRQSLRLFPDFDEARRNLRITQLKKQQQDQNQNQDQNKQNQQDQQDKQDQQNKDQQQNQDQQDKNEDQQQQQQQQQPQPQSNMTQQAAQQILNANANKEQNTRARIERQKQQRQQQGGGRSRKW